MASTQFSTHKAFADHVLRECGISVRSMNRQKDNYRLNELLAATLRLVRYGVDDFGVEYAYYAAAYGIGWAIETNRLDGQVEFAIKSLKTRELLALIHEVRMNCNVIGDVPRYLIKRHFAHHPAA